MVLKLNKDIFDSESVRFAIRDYRNLATISLSEEEGYLVCVFEGCRHGESKTAMEFENYLIDLMNCR